MRILIYGAGVIGEKSMKNEEYKNYQSTSLQKQQEDMKVTYAGIYEMCKKDYPIFWKN